MLLQVSRLGSVAPVHTRCPAAQVSVPLATQAPTGAPVEAHMPPASIAPSSATPLQLLSMPSQISPPPWVGVQAYSQPSSWLPLASTNPGAQSCAGSNRHTPRLHDGVACGNWQTRPQRPQLFASVARWKSSSIRPSQSLSRRSHASTPPLLGVQAYSQPSAATPSRSWNPGRQSVAGSNRHSLLTQWPTAPKNWQTRPHSPQLLGSDVLSNPSSITPSQLLSRPSHASTPPLLWKHRYSQPLDVRYGPVVSPSRSENPGKQPTI